MLNVYIVFNFILLIPIFFFGMCFINVRLFGEGLDFSIITIYLVLLLLTRPAALLCCCGVVERGADAVDDDADGCIATTPPKNNRCDNDERANVTVLPTIGG